MFLFLFSLGNWEKMEILLSISKHYRPCPVYQGKSADKTRCRCICLQKVFIEFNFCNKNLFKVAHFVLFTMLIFAFKAIQGKSNEIMNSMLERCCAEKTIIIL